MDGCEMSLEQFRENLISEINADAMVEQEYPTEKFIDYVEDILINDYNLLSELHHTYIEESPSGTLFRKMRLDASYLERSINTLHLLYSDYNEGDTLVINNEFIRNKTQLMINFFSNVINRYFDGKAESDPTTQLARDILTYKEDIKKLHLIIASTNKIGNRLTTFSLEPQIINGREYIIDLTLLDISRIYSTKLSTFKKEDLVLDVRDFGFDGIPCIKADIESDSYDSYLAIVPGKFLSDIYMKYSARLLESNVRSFLNTRGEINKGILNTILNNKDRFFAYNNGISTTADNIDVEFVEGKGLCITKLTNFQIINGGQTTASLASAVIKKSANLDGIYVQMKLSIIKNQNESDELVRLIAKYANKQNKVTNADLNSNHPYYTKIEEFSRKIHTPIQSNESIQPIWFFERSRGQYDQGKIQLKTKSERDKYELLYPRKKKFTKTDLAKYINSYEMKPYYVSWGAEVNMIKFQCEMEKDWDKNSTKYNEIYYKELIGKAILFKSVESIISNEDWYKENKGYRAQLVPYTISKFIYEIKKTNKIFDIKSVWDKQQIPDTIIFDIKNIAKLCFDVFYDPNRKIANIAEYTKREVCWDSVKNIDYELSNSTKKILIDKEDVEVQHKVAQKNEKFNQSIDKEVLIVRLGANYWANLIDEGKKLDVLNQHEIEICTLAIKYSKFIISSISPKQVKEIWAVKEKIDKIKGL